MAKHSNSLSSKDKFLVVHQTFKMNDAELSQYCAEKGLTVEQVIEWRDACIEPVGDESPKTRELMHEVSQAKKKKKELEQEIRRTDKALAEAKALLTLREKADAIWGEKEEE